MSRLLLKGSRTPKDGSHTNPAVHMLWGISLRCRGDPRSHPQPPVGIQISFSEEGIAM